MINRTIKVKAWHNDLKEFVQVSKYVVIDKDGVIYPSYAVTLLEFTGLLDKDNREIYEGDIVNATYVGGKVFYGTVVFDRGSFSLLIKKRPNNCLDYDVGQTPELNNFESIEILGNVYEGEE